MDDVDLRGRWERERLFHDQLAEGLDTTAPPPAEPVIYDELILRRAGVAPGQRVLELGCGSGDLTLALLDRGAEVTAIDISPRMVEIARARVRRFAPGREARFVVAPIERTGLPGASFDAIVGRWILHHVDLELAAGEVERLLAPGGTVAFLENSGANPLLRLARDHLAGRFGIPRFGTADERPLTAADWAILATGMPSVRPEYPLFELFELLDRQLLRYRWPRLTRICHALDGAIGRSERLRRHSYRVLVVADGARPTA